MHLPLEMSQTGHHSLEMIGTGRLEMIGTGHHSLEMIDTSHHSLEMKGMCHHSIETGHHSLEIIETDHHSLEIIETGHHSLKKKEIFHSHQEAIGIVGHHHQGKDGRHFLEKKWMSLGGQENVAHQVDLCLLGGEVQGEDPHSMRMREEDVCHHLPGPQESISDRDDLPLEISEAGLHLRDLIGLAILCHLPMMSEAGHLLPMMSEADHHHETGIGETVSIFQSNKIICNYM